MSFNKKNINKLFYIFIIIHLTLWTLVPTFTNNNLPLDVIEALAWGSNLDWGFNKHPPGSAFFPEIMFQIFGILSISQTYSKPYTPHHEIFNFNLFCILFS